MNLYDIRIEYQNQPVGLAQSRPRFSWKIASGDTDVVQTAYRIDVRSGESCYWDSDWVESNQSVLVKYEGTALLEETDYTVSIQVRDNHGNEAEAKTAFSTGLFSYETLNARMITHNLPADETACPVFAKEFAVHQKVAKAMLYATAHGVYEASLNGQKVGDAFMAPGWTDYKRILQVQAYDVTTALQQENRLELTVGNGWYKGILSFDCQPNRYGDRTAVLAELHVIYEDGNREVIATDDSWEVSTGSILYSEIYMGELLDTTAMRKQYAAEEVTTFDRSVMSPQLSEPVRVTERIEAKRLFVDPEGNTVIDFGQNITGLVEIHIKGKVGQRVTIRHAEVLEKGTFYTANLRQAKATDTFVLSGTEQTLMPHFTFHGFQYIAVEGIDNPTLEMFTACAMHTDMRHVGSFHCSNKLVNQLQSNISWSVRDNFFDVPTDCPQRDERLGWMGDAQVISWTASYNWETASFFRKWLRDITSASSIEKGVPHVVPDIQGTYSSAAWSDAAVIIPWVVYQSYGDIQILEDSWKCMHEWVDYIKNHTNENGLWMSGYQYGDWLALDREMGDKSVGATDVYFVSNAYYLYVTQIVSRVADVLGKKEDTAYYSELYRKTLDSFREEFYTARGRIVSETQTACVLSLYLDLAPEQFREQIKNKLVAKIEDHQTHLTTGFVGTPFLCHALSENGAHETAAQLFMKEDKPSWLYAVKMGATSIWERWDGMAEDGTLFDPGMNSMNHYANGSIGDWMYRKLGGINQLEPGYHRFYVKPMFVRGIESVSAELNTPYGSIRSAWSCQNGKIQVNISVPANTTAQIYLPEKEGALSVGSGEYQYEYETTTDLKVLKYTLDSTLGDIMADPDGDRLINEMIPMLANNPMIEYAKRMTLSEGLSAAPEIKPLYEHILGVLNAKET